ncbi:MAG: histidine kinase [Gemmatimonadetes bacterium]|nr:histidine kinase [Gemmatimonadota bacterium]
MTEPRGRRWVVWLGVVAVWTLVGLVFAVAGHITSASLGRPISLPDMLVSSVINYGIWAALTPLIVAGARRFPLEAPHRLRNLGVLVLTMLVVSPLQLLAVVLIRRTLESQPFPDLGELFRRQVGNAIVINYLFFTGVAAVYHSLRYNRAYQARERAALELEARLARAQLEVLRIQLHPHFLFNTLHAISGLMLHDVRAARRMMAQLSDLLRLSLEGGEEHLVPLRQELEFLGLYLDIQQVRFGDRLRVELAVAPDTLDFELPRLILQPLVENAIRHGIAPRAAPGRVEVRAERHGGVFRVEVSDDGVGLRPSAGAVREGIGLGNTRARLRQLYGGEHAFELGQRPGGGVRVWFEIPCTVGVERPAPALPTPALRAG